MLMSYNRAISDIDGNIGSELLANVNDYFFPALSWQQRVEQDFTLYKKFYITDIGDISFYIGIETDGLYEWTIQDSASNDEIVTDLAGSERKYGAAVVISNTTVAMIIHKKPDDLFQDGDFIYLDEEPVELTTVVDNLDETLTLTFAAPIADVDHAGETISSLMWVDLLNGIGKPIWVRSHVPVASAYDASETEPLGLVFVQ